jgi:hypothetical protein
MSIFDPKRTSYVFIVRSRNNAHRWVLPQSRWRRLAIHFGGWAMFKFLPIFILIVASESANAADESIVGTYRLISSQRLIVDTGEKEDSYGKGPTGFITYGSDGRMMVIITFSNRSKPESLDKLTDQQRADLFRTMLAYAGTYKFSGTQIEHHIDASWNEIWTGTTQVRDIKKDGGRLVFTTKPAPFPRDGKMSINTLIWEKVN